jgi:nitroreductase
MISDTDSDVHIDVECDGETLVELCSQLRANDDPHVLDTIDAISRLVNFVIGCSEGECIAVFKALGWDTSVKHIDFSRLFEGNNCTERSALAAAKYVESSKTLQTLELGYRRYRYSQEVREMIYLLLRVLSRNTSVTKLIISFGVVKFASLAFQELLTCTQTLTKLQIVGLSTAAFDEVQIAAIASGLANNTTLRDLEFNSWREVDLTPVLAALQNHPTLERIYFSAKSVNFLPSLSRLEVLLRSQNSKVKELDFERVDIRTVGLHPVLRELGRNTTVTNLAIHDSVLSPENVQQVKSMLRENTALQSLDLTSSALGSAGLAEIAPALYRNTSIKTLDLSSNGLDDVESANVLRELLRRNKTISFICLAKNAFGRNAAATRSILQGVYSNTVLQHLDLHDCKLDDQGISILANALLTRNASIVEPLLPDNEITSVGVRALFDGNVAAMNTLAKLCLVVNPVRSEGATILADALGRNAMPALK